MYRQSEKNLLNSNTSSTCPDNMVNFGPLTAEIRWRVLGTRANFNGFRVLAALLHGRSSGRQPNFAALNRGMCHLYSAGRPSRWALAHILVYVCLWLPWIAGCGHIYFRPVSICLSFFPRLISALAAWMSTILQHMMWS